MFKGLIKAILSITSMAPILLTYSFVLYLEGKSFKLIFSLIFIVILLMVAFYIILFVASNSLEKVIFQVQTIKTTDSNTISFIIDYLILFDSLNSNVFDIKVFIFFSLIMIIII